MKLKTMETIHKAITMKIADYEETYNEAKKQLEVMCLHDCNNSDSSLFETNIKDSIEYQELEKFAEDQWNNLCDAQDALGDLLKYDFH